MNNEIDKLRKAKHIMNMLTQGVDPINGDTINNNSFIKDGIISVSTSYNGREYEKVVFNEKGRRFIIEHFKEIMNYSST